MKKKPEKEPNHERWLLTYSDLITLLMIFFIILYAMSNVDNTKFQAMSSSFNIIMGGSSGNHIIGSDLPSSNVLGDPTPVVQTSPQEAEKLHNMKGTLDKYIKDENLSDNLSTAIEERGLVVTLKDTLLFDTGKAQVRKDAEVQLIKLGNILNKIPNYIRIEGHTDTVPIHSSSFSSNWQLSVIRATEVTEFLISKARIDPHRISAVGYGEFRPLAPNNTESGRSKNRRVNIVILDNKFNETEKNKTK